MTIRSIPGERRRDLTLGLRFRLRRVRDLISAYRHGPILAAERQARILSRVQASSGVLALPMLAWIGIDWISIPHPPTFQFLVFTRVVTAAAFVGLSWLCQKAIPRIDARWMLALFLATLLAFCLATDAGFAYFGVEATSPGGSAIYAYLPFVIAAATGIFPLTAVECTVWTVAVVSVMSSEIALDSGVPGLVSAMPDLWRLLLICGIAGLSSLTQLSTLVALTQRSAHDALTGIVNRQAGEQMLGQQFSFSERTNSPFSILFIDLDLFKTVNDTYGHDVGDGVLRHAARALVTSFRQQDSVIRWGGEEFLVILPNTRPAETAQIMARLSIAGVGARPDGSPQTASIGLAERITDHAADWHALVKIADLRMYVAKRAGRNQWVDCADKPHPFMELR